jgi:hypothetical protein
MDQLDQDSPAGLRRLGGIVPARHHRERT